MCKVASNTWKTREISGSLCGCCNVRNSGSIFFIYFWGTCSLYFSRRAVVSGFLQNARKFVQDCTQGCPKRKYSPYSEMPKNQNILWDSLNQPSTPVAQSFVGCSSDGRKWGTRSSLPCSQEPNKFAAHCNISRANTVRQKLLVPHPNPSCGYSLSTLCKYLCTSPPKYCINSGSRVGRVL